MIKKFAVIFICILMIFTVACSGKTDKIGYVADVTLEIRSGTLYVTLHDGKTYKTTIEADDIVVDTPEIGTGEGGSMVYAEVLKDHKTVATLSRSYVDDQNMTKGEAETVFGPLTRVRSPYEMVGLITVSATIGVIVIAVISIFLSNRKNKVEN